MEKKRNTGEVQNVEVLSVHTLYRLPVLDIYHAIWRVSRLSFEKSFPPMKFPMGNNARRRGGRGPAGLNLKMNVHGYARGFLRDAKRMNHQRYMARVCACVCVCVCAYSHLQGTIYKIKTIFDSLYLCPRNRAILNCHEAGNFFFFFFFPFFRPTWPGTFLWNIRVLAFIHRRRLIGGNCSRATERRTKRIRCAVADL